jgi:EpsI family protein
MFFSYAFPRVKYVGTNFISKLEVPVESPEWKGRDVTSSLNINVEEMRFGFINEALGHEYVNSQGKNLLFIILDAGNFHHPKNCFISSGFKIKELPDTEFNLPGRDLKAHTLFTERGKNSFLSFYWIVIDKNIAHEWIEQKLKQLYFSIFNKKTVGLMVRVDIPAREDNIEDAITLAKQFVNDLNQTLQPEHADYILGETK